MAKAPKTTEQNVAASSNLPPLSESELAAARKEGAREDVKEGAKATHHALTDGNLPGAPAGRQFTGMDEVMQYAGILDLDLDGFRERIEKGGPVPEEKVAGLLSLERAGRNRTDYVRALMKRLDVKHPHEVTFAGPAHTNDETPISKL